MDMTYSLYKLFAMEAIQDTVTKLGNGCYRFSEEAAHVIQYSIIVTVEYILLLYSYTYGILCISVLYTDTSTEVYAGIFRGCGNRIEKSVFPATPGSGNRLSRRHDFSIRTSHKSVVQV